jgi:muconolactone delta-isomerase
VEYLVTMTTRVPEGTLDGTVQDAQAREALRARELTAQVTQVKRQRLRTARLAPPLRALRDDTELGFKCPRQFVMASSAAR